MAHLKKIVYDIGSCVDLENEKWARTFMHHLQIKGGREDGLKNDATN